MTIFHLYYDLVTGGIQTLMINIANEQAAMGHTVKMLILSDKMEEKLSQLIDKRVEVISFKRKGGIYFLKAMVMLNWYLLTHKYDILHVHNPRLSIFIKVPINQDHKCCTQHCLCNGELDSDYLHCFNHIIAISDSVRDDIMKKYQIKATTVINGINFKRFKICNNVRDRDGKFRIVQVGRLNNDVKAQDILIEAVGLLKRKGIANVLVDFIGDDQGSLPLLIKETKELNVEEQVTFCGLKDQEYLAEHLCKYDLFVLPSRKEGFGLSVAEAMAVKIPVLVSDVPGPMEVIGYGTYGYYFEKGNAASCAQKIEEIMRDGTNNDMLESAYRRVCKDFDVSLTAKKYLEYYSKILSKKQLS